MITEFGQVMLYVDDVHKCAQFWTKQAGFILLGESDGTAPDDAGIPWAEVSPTAHSDTTLVLFLKEAVAKREPELDLGLPSLLFSAYNLQETFDEFRKNGIPTGEIITMGKMKTFNFSDPEGHWFAIREVKAPEARPYGDDMQKIVTNLWYDGNAEEAVDFYLSIFKDGEVQRIDRFGKAGSEVAGMPEGSVLTVEFSMFGQNFIAINGGPIFKFTPAISLMVNCETQSEVDRLWEQLSEGGEKSECGWLMDKYGLSWQVVPTEMDALLHDPDPAKAERAMAAMLQMQRLNVAEMKRAMEA